MKTLIIYFSFEGNTKFISECIAKTIDADMISLETRKKYPAKGLQKYIWGGKSVLSGEQPELTNGTIDFSSYETIIIGTPIWAGSFSPPIKTLINQYKIEGKRLALFACHAGGGAQKGFKKLKEALPGNVFISEMDFVEPLKKPEDNASKAEKWACGLVI